jgi:hypothetical protein
VLRISLSPLRNAFSLLSGGLLALGLMLAPTPVRADTIPITAGTLMIFPPPGPGQFGDRVHLEGTRGFTLDAFNISQSGDHHVYRCSGTPSGECGVPGGRISLEVGSSGSDLRGVATLDGRAFPIGLGEGEDGSAFVHFFDASFLVPSFNGTEHVSVFSPFSFVGAVAPPRLTGGPSVQLVGRGTVRVDLAWASSPVSEGWDFQHARYEFQAPAPVPEPATLVLVGSGIVGCLIRRRRRASVSST